MVETVQIAVTADTSDAGASFKELTSQIAAVRAPLAALGTASAQALQVQQDVVQDMVQQALQATRSMQQSDAAYVDAFKNGMQVLVDSKQISLQQALGFDIEYSAQVFEQEQDRLQAIRDSDAATVDDRKKALAMMQEADARYTAQASEEYRQLADAAHRWRLPRPSPPPVRRGRRTIRRPAPVRRISGTMPTARRPSRRIARSPPSPIFPAPPPRHSSQRRRPARLAG
jgi:hypothetical protein